MALIMAPEAIKSKRVRIAEVELCYLDQGPGEAAVLVHGFPVSGRIWDDHRQAMTPQIRVIAPTLRYFGSLPWIDHGRNFSIKTHADDLAGFIATPELDPVAVVGARSMGLAAPRASRHRVLFGVCSVHCGDRALQSTERNR